MALMTARASARIALTVCLVLAVTISIRAQESGARSAADGPALARLFGIHSYEYDELVDLSLDGSALIDVDASIPALVALRGATLDVGPEARLDRQAIGRAFQSPGVTIVEMSPYRRHGRRFVHVRVAVDDIRRAAALSPLSWSHYSFDRAGSEFRYVQDVGVALGRPVIDVGWTGEELVAFRLHLPSRINFHNSPENVERGNTLVWEQSLSDRLAGAPLHMEARMDTRSILYRTLWLFAGTFIAAIAALGAVVWWVGRKGRSMVPA
jgi:hypothetical protein